MLTFLNNGREFGLQTLPQLLQAHSKFNIRWVWYYWLILKMKDHWWDAKNCIAQDSVDMSWLRALLQYAILTILVLKKGLVWKYITVKIDSILLKT